MNIFSALRLPINAGPALLRETLLDLAEDELKELPMALEVLLKRMKLNSFDARNTLHSVSLLFVGTAFSNLIINGNSGSTTTRS